MAGIPLNTFKTVTFPIPTFPLDTTERVVYIASTGITSIILSAQAATVGASSGTITFRHYRPVSGSNPPVVGNVAVGGDTGTVIVNQAVVPPNDALVLLGGKLVLETFDYITLQANADGILNFVASILETANQ
jgi:hypothetical protein